MWLIFLLLPVYANAQGEESAVLGVIFNTEQKGDYFILLTEDGDVLFSQEDFLGLGVRGIPEKARIEEGYVSLRSLFPEVDFEIDERAAVLAIRADPRIFERHIIDLGRKPPQDVLYLKGDSAFFNYSLICKRGDEFDFESFGLPFEIGIRTGKILGYSNFFYKKTETEDKLVRHLTSMTIDDPRTLRRYVLGDFFAHSGGQQLGGGENFGGLSISKNFSMRPYFIRSPGLEVSGVLETPSEVKVYVNDILTRSEKLGPGEFEFLNLSATGAGETTILIRDAYGREERIMTPFYICSRLLVIGLDEYSYNLGFKKGDISRESFGYGELAFVGFHRRGLTKGLTGGIRVEADKDTINLGPTATFVLGTRGEMDTALAASNVNGQYGYGGSLGLSLASLGGINPRLSLRRFSREYGDISTSQSMSRSRSEVILGLGFRQRILGSISCNYSIQDRYEGTSQKRLSLFYSRKVLWDGSLSISANRTWDDDEVENEAFVGLNFFMGRGKTLNLNSKFKEKRTSIAASLAKNPPPGIGGGYQFQIEGDRETIIDEKTHLRGQTQLEWHGPYGIYSADYRGDSNENTYDLKLAGGLAFIDGHLYSSRPINDSFALVKVDDLKGVKVKESNQEVGQTNRRGELLVPGLVSYYDNQLSLIPEDLPLNYNILETTRYVSLPYRGGGVVEFGVVKLQAFEGRLFFIEDGKKIPPTYAELTIKIEEETIETVVGKDGEFYLENLPPGRYLARLFKEGKEGSFEMIIPESNDLIVDMGEIICELPTFEEGLATTLRFTDILPTPGLGFPRQEPNYVGKRDIKMAVEVFSDTDCVKLYVHLKNAGEVSPFISLHNFTLLTKSGQSFPQSVFRTYTTLNPFPTGLLRPNSKREGFIIFNTNDPPKTLIYKDRFGNEVLTNLPQLKPRVFKAKQ